MAIEVGDRVRIVASPIHGIFGWNIGMNKFCSCEATIVDKRFVNRHDAFSIDIDNGMWTWGCEYFEEILPHEEMKAASDQEIIELFTG